MKVFLTVCLAVLAVSAEKEYNGYKVFRTNRLNTTNVDLLREIQLSSGLDFWKEPSPGRQADIMTPPELEESVTAWLDKNGISYHTMVEDVQQLIHEPRPVAKSSSGVGSGMDWEDYHDLDTLNAWIQELADANDWANIIDIGQSYEGRDMKVLALTKAGAGAPNIWIEAGIHAREWIGNAVGTFIIRELVEDYAEHPDYIDKLNWYFIPAANPDGYAYSWEHDRMWRKTRSDHNSMLGCKGVDPNRNWDFHWAETGVSHNKCQETYCGPEAMSEVEMRNIAAFLQTLDPVPVLGHT